jgi:flagellar protein FlaF
MTYAAYSQVQQASESPRDLEIRAVADITRRLENANKPDANPIERVKALYWNNRMWTIFIRDLAEPTNKLPEKLRGSYISLGLFVQRHCAAAMAGNRDISALITINRDLLEALDQQGRESQVASAA